MRMSVATTEPLGSPRSYEFVKFVRFVFIKKRASRRPARAKRRRGVKASVATTRALVLQRSTKPKAKSIDSVDSKPALLEKN